MFSKIFRLPDSMPKPTQTQPASFIALRVSLIVCSALVLYFVMRKVRKADLEITDSIFWLLLSLLLIIAAIFPGIAYWASGLLGFDSPANFVFLCGIVVLLIRTFTQDRKIATLKRKLTTMAQTEALKDADRD